MYVLSNKGNVLLPYREGIRLAEKYQGLHDVFDTWLTGCEAQSACPLKTHGDPLDIRKQLEDMKVSVVGCLATEIE